jgi:hypothetical protein
MLHRNGTPPAPDAAQRMPAAAAARTQFLPDRPVDTPRALAYHLDRQQLAGYPLLRWLYGLLIVLSSLLLLQPGLGWRAAVAALFVLVGLWIWQSSLRSNGFVRFTPQPLQLAAGHISPRPLAPADKLPVYVSGFLSVDGKMRRFAALPGFYRTFATREHALLCQARPRRFAGLAAWPQEEEGLWYAFFHAHHILQVRLGEIAFDRMSFPGFAVEYEPEHPLNGKSRRRQPQRITLFIAFPEATDYQFALADLIVEPIPAAQLQSSTQ